MSTGKTINLDSTIARNDEIIFSDMDDEMVMMSIDKGEYYGVNPVGRRIWELLASPGPVAGICDTLCREYNVTEEQCNREVLDFLNHLLEKEVIKIVDG